MGPGAEAMPRLPARDRTGHGLRPFRVQRQSKLLLEPFSAAGNGRFLPVTLPLHISFILPFPCCFLCSSAFGSLVSAPGQGVGWELLGSALHLTLHIFLSLLIQPR